jgi:hypothetical protein
MYHAILWSWSVLQVTPLCTCAYVMCTIVSVSGTTFHLVQRSPAWGMFSRYNTTRSKVGNASGGHSIGMCIPCGLDGFKARLQSHETRRLTQLA